MNKITIIINSSGGNVDLCLITKGKSEMLRNYKKDNQKLYSKKIPYQFPKGNTRILNKLIIL